MKQEFIHKDNMDNILLGPSISKHDKPKKLMIMLHGYGDNAANFIHLAEPLDQDEWGMHYVALNAPSIMPGNPMGYQWFVLYLNGDYIVITTARTLTQNDLDYLHDKGIPYHSIISRPENCSDKDDTFKYNRMKKFLNLKWTQGKQKYLYDDKWENLNAGMKLGITPRYAVNWI